MHVEPRRGPVPPGAGRVTEQAAGLGVLGDRADRGVVPELRPVRPAGRLRRRRQLRRHARLARLPADAARHLVVRRADRRRQAPRRARARRPAVPAAPRHRVLPGDRAHPDGRVRRGRRPRVPRADEPDVRAARPGRDRRDRQPGGVADRAADGPAVDRHRRRLDLDRVRDAAAHRRDRRDPRRRGGGGRPRRRVPAAAAALRHGPAHHADAVLHRRHAVGPGDARVHDHPGRHRRRPGAVDADAGLRHLGQGVRRDRGLRRRLGPRHHPARRHRAAHRRAVRGPGAAGELLMRTRLAHAAVIAYLAVAALLVALPILYVLLTALLAAYALVFGRLRRPNLVFAFILLTMMIPGETILVANYLTIRSLGLFDTVVAVFLPFLVSAYNVFLLRQTFLSFPKEIEEAAVVDGVRPMRFLFGFLVPLCRPTVVTVTL